MREKLNFKRLGLYILLFLSTITLLLSSVGIIVYLDAGFYLKNDEAIIQDVLDDISRSDFHKVYNTIQFYSEDEDDVIYDFTRLKEYLKSDYETSNFVFKVYENDKEIVAHNDVSTYTPKQTLEDEVYKFEYGVREDLKFEDKYLKIKNMTDFALKYKGWVIPLAIVSLILTITAAYILIKTKKAPKMNIIDAVPLDLLVGLLILGLFLFEQMFYYDDGLIVMYLLISVVLFLNTATKRLRHQTLLKNNVMYKVFLFFKKSTENMPVLIQGLLLGGGLFFIEAFVVSVFDYEPEVAILFLFMINAVITYLYIRHMRDLKVLMTHSEQLAEGNLNLQLDHGSFLGLLTPIAKNLNKLSSTTYLAVEKEMKSERMKTELITNVSHDIKTPITSIINYVDLLNETQDEDKQKEYLTVLNRQSLRLKALVEDLIEASKLSTGNITLETSLLDLNVLLGQLTAEFEDKFKEKNLEIILDQKQETLMTQADGKMLSRLFDNVLMNAYQYSLENTRVYITLEKKGFYNIITVKNISKDPLNLDSESLMERFVRADSSRNTEGSGLGLSIAKSIATLHGGEFNLDVDGDLFKVSIYLKREND